MNEPAPIRTPTDARWDCHACGDCCRLYELGPVEPSIIQGLVDRRIEDHWAPAREAPWHETRRAPDGREVFFLTHRDGHCVFLRDDNLCAVHGLFGSDAKPSFCREFPFHVLDDPNGTVAVVRPSCTSIHRGLSTGTPVADQAEWAAALPRVMGRRRFAPGEVALLPDFAVSLADYMAWEARALALLDGPAVDPEVAVGRLRDALYEAAGRTPPPRDARRARLAAGAVIEAFRRLMARAAADPDPNADAHRVVFAKKCLGLLEDALTGLPAPRPLDDEARVLHQFLLRTFILAKGFHAIGSVADGLGAFLVQCAAVRAAASAAPVTAAAASAVVVPWTKLTENPAIAGVMRMARPALIDVFVHTEV